MLRDLQLPRKPPVIAFANGEDCLPHIAHLLACAAILLDADVIGNLVDDRPTGAPVCEMIQGLIPEVAIIRERYAAVEVG